MAFDQRFTGRRRCDPSSPDIRVEVLALEGVGSAEELGVPVGERHVPAGPLGVALALSLVPRGDGGSGVLPGLFIIHLLQTHILNTKVDKRKEQHSDCWLWDSKHRSQHFTPRQCWALVGIALARLSGYSITHRVGRHNFFRPYDAD